MTDTQAGGGGAGTADGYRDGWPDTAAGLEGGEGSIMQIWRELDEENKPGFVNEHCSCCSLVMVVISRHTGCLGPLTIQRHADQDMSQPAGLFPWALTVGRPDAALQGW